MLGQCLIKHWSKTQTTISLSSGEAELHGIVFGAAQALGMQSLLKDLGWSMKVYEDPDPFRCDGRNWNLPQEGRRQDQASGYDRSLDSG